MTDDSFKQKEMRETIVDLEKKLEKATRLLAHAVDKQEITSEMYEFLTEMKS